MNPAIPEDSAPADLLIAYLDGELDADTRHALEEQLRTRPDLRQQLKELQQSWDLLDELPREQVEDTFTRTTVEMVAIHADEEATRRLRVQARRRAAAWGIGLCSAAVAGLLGFWVTQQQLSQPNRKLVEDLPILENLDAYQSAGSIEFLRLLDEEGLFKPEGSDAQ